MDQQGLYIVAYDISEDRRLRKVAKVMEGFGDRVQKSVFECDLNDGKLREMVKRARAVMNEKEDGLRVYRLCGKCRAAREAYGIGQAQDLPEAVVV